MTSFKINFRKLKSDLWILLFIIFLSLLINIVLIILRIEIVQYNAVEPNYTLNYDALRWDSAPFYTDELTYYNFNPQESFITSFQNRIILLYEEKNLLNINLYGYYILFLKEFFNFDWIGILLSTGAVYNIIFIILMFYVFRNIIELDNKKMFFFLILIIISPPYLQLISSWLRDLLIIDLLLMAFIFAEKNKFFFWTLVTVIQMFIRAYMIIPHIIILLFFYNKKSKKYNIFKRSLFSFLILFVLAILLINQFGFLNLKEEFIPRLVQNFTGICVGLIRGDFFLREGIYNYLYNIEMLSGYFYFIFYSIFHFYFFSNIFGLNKRLDQNQRKYLCTFLFIGLFIVMLHSSVLGFFVSRIQFITMIFGYLFLGSLLKTSNNKIIMEKA